MSEGNSPPPPLVSPGYYDPSNSIFSINTEEWLDHPPLPGVGEDTVKSLNPCPFFLDRYRQSADPAEWNHYIILGLFVFIDGQAFESQEKGPRRLVDLPQNCLVQLHLSSGLSVGNIAKAPHLDLRGEILASKIITKKYSN